MGGFVGVVAPCSRIDVVVYVCVCVSLPALVQLAVPCEGGWLVLVPSALYPSFYTLAKAKRGGSQHNRKPLVITVGLGQSRRVIA